MCVTLLTGVIYSDLLLHLESDLPHPKKWRQNQCSDSISKTISCTVNNKEKQKEKSDRP